MLLTASPKNTKFDQRRRNSRKALVSINAVKPSKRAVSGNTAEASAPKVSPPAPAYKSITLGWALSCSRIFSMVANYTDAANPYEQSGTDHGYQRGDIKLLEHEIRHQDQALQSSTSSASSAVKATAITYLRQQPRLCRPRSGR